MALQDRLHDLVQPLVAERDLELFDLVYAGGTLTVLVQRPDVAPTGGGAGTGVDIDAIAKLSRAISRVLDEVDPISGAYTLEVSTPGLERPLRTPAHFAGAVGEQVSVKATADFDGPRRVKGALVAASDDDITLQSADDLEPITIALDSIDKARTVFEWAAEPKGGGSSSARSSSGAKKSGAKTKPGAKTKSRATSPSGATSGAESTSDLSDGADTPTDGARPSKSASQPKPASKKVTSS